MRICPAKTSQLTQTPIDLLHSIDSFDYFVNVQSPPLTWRPLNFSSGLSTRGKLRSGTPMKGSGRCGGGGVGNAVWVGWKLLITHDT